MSQLPEIENIIRANYPNGFFREGYIEEVVASVKAKLGDISLGEMRRALTDLSERNPERIPNVHEIARQISINRDQGKTSNIADTSADSFIEKLKAEPDPEKRWSMICHAGSDTMVRGIGYLCDGVTHEGKTIWRRNPAHLYCETGEEPCQRAQRLADRHRIEYRRFSPMAGGLVDTMRQGIAQDARKRGQGASERHNLSADMDENENASYAF